MQKAKTRSATIGCLAVTLYLLTGAPSAGSQQANKVSRIGYLATDSRAPTRETFRQGLADFGYIEGQNVVLEYRWADRDERLHELARELVQQKVDVILTGSTPATIAAKEATKTIPIVF